MQDPRANEELESPSRRQFVNRLFLAGAGTMLASSLPAFPTWAAGAKRPPAPGEAATPAKGADGPKLGWAVAGLGDFGENYVLPAISRSKHGAPVALISGTPEKAARLADKYGVKKEALYNYANMGNLKNNPEVSVVYIVTPNSTHADLTVKALEAGKHVMCEKPMANSPAECRRMIDAAKAAGRKLMIAYRVHFEPNNVKAKEMIDAGELGNIAFATSDHHRPLEMGKPRDEWRMKKSLAGGGSLVDIGVYSLNGLIWLLGESPSAVSASTYANPEDPRFREVENICTAQLVFPSGRRATISSGYDASRKRAEIFGSKLTLTLDPATEYEGNQLWAHEGKDVRKISAEDSDVQFTGEVDHLSLAIRDNQPVKTPGEMGLRDVRIIEAIYKSAKSGRWVKLNPDGSAQA